MLSSTSAPVRNAAPQDPQSPESAIGQSRRHDPTFFPGAVWYSGGKARAPMLETITPDSPRVWKEDLSKIEQLGFNTVRTWVEWNVAEPEEGLQCTTIGALPPGGEYL